MRGILVFIVVFLLLVLVHEFGHFIVAKKSGVLVREFSIGMGPKLFQKMYNQTTYTIRWLPLGGYVRMAGPDDTAEIDPGTTVVVAQNESGVVTRIDASERDVPIDGLPIQVTHADLVDDLTITGFENADENKLISVSVDHDATFIEQNGTELLIAPRDTLFTEAPTWKKLLTNIAGPFNNILLGFIVFILWSLFSQGVIVNTVQSTMSASPAAEVGLQKDDQIVAVNGQKTDDTTAIANAIQTTKKNSVKLTIKRGHKNVTVSLTPKTVTQDGQKVKQIGVYWQQKGDVGTKLERGFSTAANTSGLIFNAVKGLFTGFSLNKLSGPVGIYAQTSKVADLGWSYIITFFAMISINLGIVNLLPVPGLDGGKILLNLVELIIRRPIPPEKEGIINMIGFVLLLALIIAVTGNDIYRYLIK